MNRNWSKVVQNLSQMAELNRACVNPVEDEAINVVHIGKDHIEGCFLAALEINRQLAKVDILGVKPDKDCTCKAVENEKSCEGDISVLEQSNGQLGLTNCFDFNLAKDMIKSPREVVGKDLEVNTNGIQDSQLENMDPVTSQALEDIRCMGLQNMVGKTLSPLERTKDKSYWEKWVDRQNNAQVNLGDSFAYREMVGSLEESRGFFPDYAPKRRVFASMLSSKFKNECYSYFDRAMDFGVISPRTLHKNLLGLRGYCVGTDQRLIVYDYIPNLSLLSHLHDQFAGDVQLDWKKRMKIVVGSAKGIL
ncbi:hypothetical protein V6N11_056811 [Hibiscus sabdariffa]|uniref:Uncharacterized protein n=1 Tax=Hibiscus sabdariffa TaxID=183260 RepID=A0ABR2T4X2_9ROSI